MTADFLGQSRESLTDAHVDGTLIEALNMVGGSTLTQVNETDYMGLGIPKIVPTPVCADVDETIVLNAADDLIIARVKLG